MVKGNGMDSGLWSAKVMVGVGLLMLLLTSLQGWGMVGIVAFRPQDSAELLQELKRLHNLGLSGGFLAISCGLILIVLPLEAGRSTTICRLLLPSFLIAPIAFCDRVLVVLAGAIPSAVQALFFALQAASALGITLGLGLIVLSLFRHQEQTR
jgi:hypothetical protein